MDDDSVNSLVKFLSNPNRKAEEHVETVMSMVRELSKYKHILKETKEERDRLKRSLYDDMRPEQMGFAEHPGRRDYDPRNVTIPSNARSVEIKF